MRNPGSGDPSAASGTPRPRASDAQRTAVLTALDAAFADGRLSRLEHLDRTRIVTHSRFIDELRTLVADLRDGDADLGLEGPEPEQTQPQTQHSAAGANGGWLRTHPGLIVGLIVVALVAIAGGVAVYASDGSSSSDSSSSDTNHFGPLFTTDGADQMLSEARSEFGAEPIDTLTVYGNNAILLQEDPTEPGKRLTQAFKGKWEETAFSSRTDSPTFQLSDVSPDALTAALSTAAEELGTDLEQTGHVFINADVLGQPEYRVSVYEDKDITTVVIGYDGQVRKVDKAN